MTAIGPAIAALFAHVWHANPNGLSSMTEAFRPSVTALEKAVDYSLGLLSNGAGSQSLRRRTPAFFAFALPPLEKYIWCMIQTAEAVIDEHGIVRLLEPVHVVGQRRALVTILDEQPGQIHETAILSEHSLGEDWNRPEEDAAWSHLQRDR